MGLYDSWVFKKYISPSSSLDNVDIIYELKELMVSAGHAVTSSGTGFSGTGSGVYNATGDAISSAALLDNQHAWFRIEGPGGREWCFQGQGSSYGNVWRVKVSTAAGFSGGAPSASRTPSAADEQIIWGSGTDASPFPSHSHLLPGANSVAYMGVDTAAPYGWYCGVYKSSTARIETLIGLFEVKNCNPLDDPAIYHADRNASASVAIRSRLGSASTGPEGWIAYGDASVTWGATPCYAGSGGGATHPASTDVDPYDGTDGLLEIEIYRPTTVSSPGGRKGILAWAYWGTPIRTALDTRSVQDNYDHITLGELVMPWNGTVP